ncbi:LeuA family protein [Halomarina halobia]|uniref:2-isopropylmalate synthase n=1 Tax=Halomarina halobia TaxID=3033386 RepID=A0ABD6AF03_9EURY|nr:LeuA family protein [Halomarina sp. PSR21]
MELTDVTLREGAQMPGRSYTIEQRIAAGRELDRLGLAAVQAGFPAVGDDHAAVTRRLAADLDADVSGLARAVPGDVDAVIDAEADVVNVFAAVSSAMLDRVFDTSREAVLDMLDDAVARARNAGVPVRVGLMDGFRTEVEHVVTVSERFPDLPLGLADTVGGRTPAFVETFLEELAEAGVDLARLGVHFHDDLGVATANTLVAAGAGVGSADVSVAALGERAGNTPLEQLVVAGDRGSGDTFGIDTAALIPACRGVLDALDEAVDPRRPVLGEEVVRHESGLHTTVMLETPWVFEPFDPATFGGERELVFGRLTGRGAARRLLARVGGEQSERRVDALLDALAKAGPVGLEGALSLARDVSADEGR